MSVLAKKLGLKSGMQALILAAPPGYIKLLAPASDVAISSKADGKYEFMQVFATRLAEVDKFAELLAKHAAQNALVWIAYPKKTAKVESDLSRDVVHEEMMKRVGWRAVAIVAIDAVWAALRVRPVELVKTPVKRAGG